MPDDNKDENIQEEVIEDTPETTEEEFIDETTNERIAEFLGEEPEEVTEPEELEEPEEPEVTEVTEEPEPEPEPEPTPEPEEPLEDVIKKTTEETLKQMGVSKEEKEELEEEGFKFAWEDRGEDRPASWKEQSEETIRLMRYQEQKSQEALKLREQESVKQAEQESKEINQYWDEQLAELREDGLIPQIAPEVQKKISEGKSLTKAERNDPGLKAQAEIFEQMYNLAQERESQGKKPISDIHHIYYRYLTKEPKKPSGADAPVSGGSSTTPVPTEEEISYEQLHRMDFEDILKI